MGTMAVSRPEAAVTLNAFQQQALKLAAKLSTEPSTELPALQSLREKGLDDFSRAIWPGRKTEQWKYLSLLPLHAYEQAAWAKPVDTAALSAAVDGLPDLEASRLVFVDGRFHATLSDPMPDGVSLFSQASSNAEQKSIMEKYLGQIEARTEAGRRNLFAALNNAWLSDGLLLHLTRNTQLSQPLYIVHISSSDNSVANHRVLLVLEEGAEASVIEQYLSCDVDGDAQAFVNSLTEIAVGCNARLHHTRLHQASESTSHIGSVHLSLQRDAVFKGFTLAEGSRLTRIDYQMNHQGEGANLDLAGVYLARHRQQVDYHTTIEHTVPHCTSQETFRGIVGGRAKAVFNGRIHIHQDAQKTLAELNNRNLLTSSKAEVDTKPELEIYADDVRCAHGATVSELDAEAMYYLQSRGISPLEARMMLSYGFINELLEKLPHEALRHQLQVHLKARFLEDMPSD